MLFTHFSLCAVLQNNDIGGFDCFVIAIQRCFPVVSQVALESCVDNRYRTCNKMYKSALTSEVSVLDNLFLGSGWLCAGGGGGGGGGGGWGGFCQKTPPPPPQDDIVDKTNWERVCNK